MRPRTHSSAHRDTIRSSSSRSVDFEFATASPSTAQYQSPHDNSIPISASRAMSEMPPGGGLDRSSAVRPWRTSRRISLAVEKAGARLDKGKGRAQSVEQETPQSIDESWDAESSAGGAQRGAKRRRVMQSSLCVDTEAAAEWDGDGDEDNQMTAVDEDFHMQDGSDGLPWIPTGPNAKDSEYVPPGLNVNTLIKDMKRALVLEISARQKAENMHAEERRRRLALQQQLEATRAQRSSESDSTIAFAEISTEALQRALGMSGPVGAAMHDADAMIADADPRDTGAGASAV